VHPGAIFPTRSGFGILSSGASAAGPLKGVFESLFEALSSDLDFEYTIIDGTIVRAHQHGIETRNQAIGRSRGGLTTKIVAMVEALGNLVRLVLLPGQRHDSVGVEPLIEGIAFDALLGDKAFDNDWLRVELDRRGASALIPPKAGRARHISVSTCTNGVISSKTSSAITVPSHRHALGKTGESYAAMIHLAGTRFAEIRIASSNSYHPAWTTGCRLMASMAAKMRSSNSARKTRDAPDLQTRRAR
jgi:hypothetical protein